MIRFSAALVVVAVAVLIGGVATSTLLLVYVAIVLSAAALIALAIGVAVKRNELFGDTGRPVGDVMGTAAGQSSSGYQPGAQSYGGQSYGAQSYGGQPSGSSPVGGQPAGGQGFGGTPAAPGASGSYGEPVAEPAPAVPSTSASRSAPLPGAERRAVTETRADLRALGGEPLASSPAGSSSPGSSSPGLASATADETRMDLHPVRPEPVAEKPSSGLPSAVTETRFDLKAVLDESPAGQIVPSTPLPARRGAPLPGFPDSSGSQGGASMPAASASAPPSSPAPSAAAPPASPAPSPGPATPAANETRADLPALGTESVSGQQAMASAAPASSGPETRFDLPAQSDKPAALSGSSQVAIIPGVPRYHTPGCILIRFMDEEDLEKKTLDEAVAAGCTPCTACQGD